MLIISISNGNCEYFKCQLWVFQMVIVSILNGNCEYF